jgi:leucyl aminopeptidase (aminopeptidase T)
MERLGVHPHDRVVIVSNPPQRRIAEALLAVSSGRACVVRHLEYPTLGHHGEEPPRIVAKALCEATVVFAPTVYSISHTQARLDATAHGVRIAGMSSLDDAAFASALPIDYERLEQSTGLVASALSAASACHITSPAGTDLHLRLDGRTAREDNGNLRHVSAFGNLPAGEAYIAPLEACGEGTIVVDGSLSGYGLVRRPLHLRLRGGRLVGASGGDAAAWLLTRLEAAGDRTGRVVAEFGVGVNPGARITGLTILDEKARGTAHVAFGTNVSFGGTNTAGVHIDAVLRAPTVHLDGVPLLENGEPHVAQGF